MNFFGRFQSFLDKGKRRTGLSLFVAGLAFAGFCGAVIIGRASPWFPFFWIPGLAACLSLSVIHYPLIRSLFSGGRIRPLLGPGVTFAAFLAVLIIAGLLTARRPLRVDLTSSRMYTLSSVTRRILADLQEPVRMVFFRTPAGVNQSVGDVLRLYGKASQLVTIEEIDPEEKPLLAQKYDLQSLPLNDRPVYATIFVEQAGKTEKVDGLTVDFVPDHQGGIRPVVEAERNLERKISSALDRLRRPVKKIYFTAGHGEGDLNSAEKSGYSRLRNYLSQENYDTDLFYPASSSGVPQDASLVVILDPRKRFEDREITLLDAYLRNGGRILILVNPRRPHGLNRLTKSWGFVFASDIVHDPGSSYWFQPTVPYVTRYGLHEAVGNLTAASVFPEVSSLVRIEGTDSRVRELLRSSDQSWGKTGDGAGEGKASYIEGVDRKGPLSLAMASETEREDSAGMSGLIGFGDADFVANGFADLGANLDLFLNCVNTLADKKELTGIRSRESSRRIMMLGNASLRFLFLISVIILPLSFLVAGIVFFWKRRRR